MEDSRRKWVSITLLSIIIPVGLLVGFRLTGILQEPLAPEVIEAEQVSWNMTRPIKHKTISEELTNIYSTKSTLVKLVVALYDYDENSLSLPFEGNDGLTLGLTASVNLSAGFVHSVALRFYVDDGNASLDILEDSDVIHLYNIEVQKIVDWQPVSYVETLAVKQPEYCMLETFMSWVFFDENNVDHRITSALEVTYFNGTTYRMTVLPIQLEVFIS